MIDSLAGKIEAGLLSSDVGSGLVAGGLLTSVSVMAFDGCRMVGHTGTRTVQAVAGLLRVAAWRTTGHP